MMLQLASVAARDTQPRLLSVEKGIMGFRRLIERKSKQIINTDEPTAFGISKVLKFATLSLLQLNAHFLKKVISIILSFYCNPMSSWKV